jgi:hypothetical protein
MAITPSLNASIRFVPISSFLVAFSFLTLGLRPHPRRAQQIMREQPGVVDLA